MISLDNPLGFPNKIWLLVLLTLLNHLYIVEILSNIEYHQFQNDFYDENSLNKMSVIVFDSFSTSKCFNLFELVTFFVKI